MSKPRKGQREAARPENRVSLDDVVALIKERKKYADWISALEAKRDQTPANVYAKVHLDYETRLQAVVEKLSAHRGSLSQDQESLKKKLEEVQQEIEERQEERSETELRAQIGELTAAALTEALMEADTELERLEARQSSLETELGRIDEFFAAVDGTGSGRISSPSVAKRKTSGFDEMSFLNSVVGAKGAAKEEKPDPTPAPEPPPKPAPAPPAPPKVEPPAPPSEAPPLKPVEVPVSPEPTPTPTPTPTPAPQADGGVEKATELEKRDPRPVPRQSIAMQMASLTIEPGAGAKAQSDLGIIKTGDELPPSILEDLSPKSGPVKPLAANIASNDPFTLKASSAGNTKNLKCKECGAFNFSTEWYCEKCGAELSVL